MAKKHELAFEQFEESKGTLSNAQIATLVGSAESTVRKWKSRYKWLEQLGIEKNVTPTRKGTVTKKEPSIRERQQKAVEAALIEAGTYSPALDLLIEIYLDAYVEYVALRDQGIVEEKHRREVARLLGQLGLDGKNKELIKASGKLLAKEESVKDTAAEPSAENSKLIAFRQRRAGGSS